MESAEKLIKRQFDASINSYVNDRINPGSPRTARSNHERDYDRVRQKHSRKNNSPIARIEKSDSDLK